jgi:ribosomal protein L9
MASTDPYGQLYLVEKSLAVVPISTKHRSKMREREREREGGREGELRRKEARHAYHTDLTYQQM